MVLVGSCQNWYREAVALGRDRLNILLAVGRFSELPAQHRYVHREVRFFHEAIRPYPAHQFFFAREPVAVLNEHLQNLECLWCESNRLPVAFQQMILRIKTKSAEFVQMIDPSRLSRSLDFVWKFFTESLTWFEDPRNPIR